jgi:ParB family chromosome partitioning protein
VRLETIRLSRINFRDERFRISCSFDPAPMAESIRKVGLRNPPLVKASGGRFVVVSGWKRILACREAGVCAIPALVIDEADDLGVFLAVVEENRLHRVLSLAEKALVFDKLRRLGAGQDSLVREIMPALSLPKRASFLQSLLSLAGARADVRKFAHEKKIQLGVLEALLRFDDAERTRLLPILYSLGDNKQKEVLDDLWDIRRRDGVSVRRLLAGGAIGETLRSDKLHPAQKADRVRRLLRSLRYPALARRRAAFDAVLRKSGLPRAIVIQPSPGFESDSVCVSFRFGNAAELRERLRKLEALASAPELRRLFRE